MPFDTPRLDDRTFEDLVQEALRRIPQYTPEWTDHNLSDPGITLIELFAWMTDVLLYRLNRVPDRHYVKLMELIGMKLREPEAAQTRVTFWLSAPQATDIQIPQGTEVSTTRTETEPAIIFSTDELFTIRVAELNNIMTSYRPKDSEERVYTRFDVQQANAGFSGFSIFQEEPQAGDAVYFGFRTDLSHHILGLDMNMERAAGAGIDPTRPPYVWEVLAEEGPPNRWVPCELDEDGTRAFNIPGITRLHLPEMAEGTLNRRRAYWVRCRLLAREKHEAQYRESPKLTRVIAGSWGATMNTTHAARVLNEMLGRSDGTPGQKFYLERPPVLPRRFGMSTQLTVRHEGKVELWTEVPDFATSTNADHHYILDSANGEIRFGPAMPQRDKSIKRYGAIPPKDSMIVMQQYYSGGGTVGNVQKFTLNVLKTSIPYVDRVLNRQPAFGGLEMENLEDAKLRVPGHLRSLRRAVTAKDFEYLAKEAAPGKIARVYALPIEGDVTPVDGGIVQVTSGFVNVFVIPQVINPTRYVEYQELKLDSSLQATVREYLDERRLLTTKMDVLEPEYYWVQTQVRLKVSDHADPKKVEQAVLDRLYAFINPITGGYDKQGWPFGRDLMSSDVIACLQGVAGIDFIRSVELFWRKRGPDNKPVTEKRDVIETVSYGVIASYTHKIITDEQA